MVTSSSAVWVCADCGVPSGGAYVEQDESQSECRGCLRSEGVPASSGQQGVSQSRFFMMRGIYDQMLPGPSHPDDARVRASLRKPGGR